MNLSVRERRALIGLGAVLQVLAAAATLPPGLVVAVIIAWFAVYIATTPPT